MAHVLIARVSYDVLIANVLIARVDCTVKPEITHTLGGHQMLWVMAFLRFIYICVIRVGGLKMLWVITGYGLSQYGLSQV